MTKPVKVLCIGGSDSSGGAGIQADLKAVSACGCYGLTVVTAVTVQNTRGVQTIHPVPQKFIVAHLDAVLTDIGADALKTGMLLTAGAVLSVAGKIKEYALKNVVVDPVMVAKGGHYLMQENACKALIDKLLPLAFVITPNIPEAESLCGLRIKSLDSMKKAAVLIHKMGPKNVLIKGGHLPGGKHSDVIDILYDGNRYYEFTASRIDTKDTHGTGCTFASLLAAGLANGMNIVQAAGQAKSIVTEAIVNSLRMGKGHGPVNVFGKFN